MVRVGSLFSGYGGLDMGVAAALGGTLAWHSELDPAASRVLEARFPGVPNLGDITTADWATVEPVDVLCGGPPCQDVSVAGLRAGLRPSTRSGLWSHMAYAIAVLRPSLVVVENVRGLLSASAHSDVEPCPWCLGDGPDNALRALGAVLGDLADLRYDARWRCVRASDAGAPHSRERVFIVAADAGRGNPERRGEPADMASAGREAQGEAPERERSRDAARDSCGATPDAASDGRNEGRPEPTRLVGRPHAAERGASAPADTDSAGRGRVAQLDAPEAARLDSEHRRHPDGRSNGPDWGPYTGAIRRWEAILGRPAPDPTEPGQRGGARLSPRFTEWLMGLPDGWVTDVPGVGRNAQLRILGNGCVPQQVALALSLLLDEREVAA